MRVGHLQAQSPPQQLPKRAQCVSRPDAFVQRTHPAAWISTHRPLHPTSLGADFQVSQTGRTLRSAWSPTPTCTPAPDQGFIPALSAWDQDT